MFQRNSSVRMAHEYGASKDAFEKATQIMCAKVSIPCSGRYNASYSEKDLHHSLVELSISNGYAESGMERLALEAAALSGRKVPSGSWVRDTIGKVPEGEMNRKLGQALKSTLDEIGSFRLFNVPIMAAIDKHKVPRYDPTVDGGFLRRGKRDGARRGLRCMLLYSASRMGGEPR